ncbi:class A beta-lactamase-related serine hydrolase [Actinomycetospora endophytica]|uniref:Class A beta-lactamase-related serine hydrolase n=1 Tax=Actinomycetospora endophytica TaxID=2291215 RepID=A0ABS8P228_9PSEU|nr:serine hydrolase [Actinomycetospora endophytica]MCD2192037.1 class A beta-lactamase-related serine hydrolase [Actinomycetospora endophytica]
MTAVLLLAATGCAAPTLGRCAAPPAPDVGTTAGWVGYLAAHRDDVAFVIDDGRGTRLEHRADTVVPMASASKALNLAAYARAVALGVVRPDEPVRLGDWERWEVYNPTETAHARALDHLGIPRAGNRATDPDRIVTIEQLATEISIWSDDAGPDYLRARLGDQALLDTAHDVGWADPELISTTGFLVSLFTPELVPPATDRPARRAAEWALAQRYATDPAFRADADTRNVAPAVEARWADGGPGGTARQLQALWSAVGRGSFPGADRARALAEQDPDPGPGITALGAKGGSLTGVLTRGIELRRDDGTVATAVLLVRHMSELDTRRVDESSQAFNDVLVASVQSPEVTAALRCQL